MTETADVTLPQLVYEEIREVPAPQLSLSEASTTGSNAVPTKSPPAAVGRRHLYGDVEAAGVQAAAETGADHYHFTLCSAYGVALENNEQRAT